MSNPVIFFEVLGRDGTGSLERAKSLGGSAMMAPMDLPGGGTIGLFTDPEGHTIGLYKPADQN